MSNNEGQSTLEKNTREILWCKYGVRAEDADRFQLYYSISEAVKRMLQHKYQNFKDAAKRQSSKRICYLSMEFLIGKSLKNNLYNLGLLETAADFIKKCSFSAEEVFSVEKDAGLGNGGLGRLAACYLDALATSCYRGEGYSILYEYGIFKQYFSDGEQMELPDTWLDSGDVWLSKNNEKKIIIKLGGTLCEENGKQKYKDYREIIAEGYDMYIPGYKSSGVSLLKLWKAVPSDRFEMSLLNDANFDAILSKRSGADIISMFLYPPDNTEQGKQLRLVQQYFLVSATIQSVVSEHYRNYRSVENLDEHICFHINDTHPALCIPELIRVLTDDYGLDFDKAFQTVKNTVSYTNHTVMPEALEVWDENMVKELFPRVYAIIKEINKKVSSDMYSNGADAWEKISELSIISSTKIRMANMAVLCSNKVNGVSSLHSKIIKDNLFAGFSQKSPDKFLNVTNAISYRRWLCQANPMLASLLDSTIGDNYREIPHELTNFAKFANDKEVTERFENARYENKRTLSNISKKLVGEYLDPDSMFDVQIKRLHEYKRQLLNVLKIMTYYCELTSNPNADISPKTFIFGAKAAPSYAHAKRIIKLINKMSELIKKNSRVKDILQVVFLPDYNVSLAERIIPAADLSEQISLAGKEASGTGNMKFMLNGALTLGTYDGANVEISELVGEDNIYIFGMDVEGVSEMKKSITDPTEFIKKDPRLEEVLKLMRSDICGDNFSDIADYLTSTDNPDPYFCLADYGSYMQHYRRACIDYKNKRKWFSKAIINTANAGYFASDRAIEEYAEKIWQATRVKNK